VDAGSAVVTGDIAAIIGDDVVLSEPAANVIGDGLVVVSSTT
jgi:hypothetical protein